MRQQVIVAGVFLVMAGIARADDLPAGSPDAEPAPASVSDRASYAIGLNIGESLKSDGLEVNGEMLVRGVLDALNNRKPVLSEADLQAALLLFRREMDARLKERRAAATETNKKEGDAFRMQNGRRPDVTTLASGLQFRVLQSGNGKTPKLTDRVKTHYSGRLIDGTVFDSSIERGEPAVFPVSGVIRGWTEALQRMKVGDKWELVIPPELAYGPRGAGSQIGPHATLVFEIELLEVEP